MGQRRNEDVEVVAVCYDDDCEEYGMRVSLEGRYNADGEFEVIDEDDLYCDVCGNRLEFDADE